MYRSVDSHSRLLETNGVQFVRDTSNVYHWLFDEIIDKAFPHECPPFNRWAPCLVCSDVKLKCVSNHKPLLALEYHPEMPKGVENFSCVISSLHVFNNSTDLLD